MAEIWDETKPAGSRNPIFGDDDIREFKRAIRERLAEDHEFTSTESPAFGASNYKIGKHRYLTLLETSGDKTTLENEVCILAKDLDGHPEIYIVPESGGTGILLTRNNASKIATDIGFHNGEIDIAWPTNNLDSTSTAPKIMVGNSNTVAWFYVNTAPPGWKVLITGLGRVLAISDISGMSYGTATSTLANKLIDSGATFETDGIETGHTAYNATDQTVATVSNVDSQTQLSLDGDIFTSGENYRVGKAYVEDGGRLASDSSWTISNLAASLENSHTHGHNHQWYKSGGASADDKTYNSVGTSEISIPTASSKSAAHEHLTVSVVTSDTPPGNMYTDKDTTAGTQHSHVLSHTDKWRPRAAIGKLFQLDTSS